VAKSHKLSAQQENVLLREQNRRLRLNGFATGAAKVVNTAVKYGMLALIVYFMRDPFIAWSGKTTKTDISISAHGSVSAKGNEGAKSGQSGNVSPPTQEAIPFSLGSTELTVSLALLFGIAGIGYGRREARLRRQVIERFHPYQLAEERSADARRSSSRLTPTGETRPEDDI
jgi:hypothetical protein